jgi:hypothetical protein
MKQLILEDLLFHFVSSVDREKVRRASDRAGRYRRLPLDLGCGRASIGFISILLVMTAGLSSSLVSMMVSRLTSRTLQCFVF